MGAAIWRFSGREFQFGPRPTTTPLLMGIVNTTPDSFSDGGQYLAAPDAIDHAQRLMDAGADIIDIGGQSTRPGSEPVGLETEIGRALPVIEGLRKRTDALISIDTSKAEVARRAIAAGAQIVNDVTSLRDDPDMIQVLSACDTGLIIMHMIGTPKTMQLAARYNDVVAEVCEFLADRLSWLSTQGMARDRIAIDPGLGFGKRTAHNLRLVRELDRIGELGQPICLGPSRKHFIGKVLNRPLDQRAIGTAAVAVAGYLRGAQIFRVHDVAATRDALLMIRAIEHAEEYA